MWRIFKLLTVLFYFGYASDVNLGFSIKYDAGFIKQSWALGSSYLNNEIPQLLAAKESFLQHN